MTAPSRAVEALFRLDGQTAIVTGAGAGIGRAIALMFADAGAWVAAVDRDEASVRRTCALIGERGGQAACFALDVTEASAPKQVIDQTLERHERLDVLVNNAGIYPPAAPLP